MKKLSILCLALLLPLLVACSGKDKEEVMVSSETEVTALANGTYVLDADASTLYWEAYKPIGGHMGGINLKSGELVVEGNKPSSGSFVIDMTTIRGHKCQRIA